MKKIVFAFFCFVCSLYAEEDFLIETDHQITLGGKLISYSASAGTLPLKDENDKIKAHIFFISYVRNDLLPNNKRPIFFCFNGGPGCPSIWLHLGMLGPKKIQIDEKMPYLPPYTLLDNPNSLLDVADLVFIDPIATGYSRVEAGEDPKQYFGVEGDIKSIAEFVRLYCTKYGKWNSPKFLVGESYGTTRAAGLAAYLHDYTRMYINGIILVSSILNYQTLLDNEEGGNDLPYILLLPPYTLAAWYHQKLPEELQSNSEKALAEAETFALDGYARALLYGDKLTQEEKKEVIAQLARLTGLPDDFIAKKNLRIDQAVFRQSLFLDQGEMIGRFDSRMKGLMPVPCEEIEGPKICDPFFEAALGSFTAMAEDYMHKELKVPKTIPYVMLANVLDSWVWTKSTNQFLNISTTIRDLLCKNPQVKILVMSGKYDLATSYFATRYTFNHLFLPQKLKQNIHLREYEGGHMMYMEPVIQEQMRMDILDFLKSDQ